MTKNERTRTLEALNAVAEQSDKRITRVNLEIESLERSLKEYKSELAALVADRKVTMGATTCILESKQDQPSELAA